MLSTSRGKRVSNLIEITQYILYLYPADIVDERYIQKASKDKTEFDLSAIVPKTSQSTHDDVDLKAQ